jgi:5'-AMP-activated protein kinase catalytic alpha subunit
MAAGTSGEQQQHLHARYEVEEIRIGEGAYANVYPARHRLTGRHVAVKIFHAPTHAEEGGEEGAEREIRIMRQLRHHPHVIRFYEATVIASPDVGDSKQRKKKDKTKKQQPQQVCIVMELAESGELYNHVLASDRGLEEGEARRVFRQLVSGVAYCHRNMVVHHDLKLENVLLDAGKNVKLADFGFSNFFGPVQIPGAACGSLLYAAPEVTAERTEDEATRYLGPEVDMWSCGVILFAMLCGYLPFDGPDDDEPAIKRRIAVSPSCFFYPFVFLIRWLVGWFTWLVG